MNHSRCVRRAELRRANEKKQKGRKRESRMAALLIRGRILPAGSSFYRGAKGKNLEEDSRALPEGSDIDTEL